MMFGLDFFNEAAADAAACITKRLSKIIRFFVKDDRSAIDCIFSFAYREAGCD